MKWIIALFAAAGIYTAASFFTGTQIETKLDSMIAQNEGMLQGSGYTLDVSNIKRGIFTSTADFSLTHPAMINANGKLKIYHGPVLFKGGLGLGAMATVGHFESLDMMNVSFNDNAYLKSVKWIARFGFFDSIDYKTEFPKFDGPLEGDAHLNFAGANIAMATNTKTERGTYTMEMGALVYKMGAGVALTVDPASGSGDYHVYAPGVILQNFSMQVPRIKMEAGNINQNFEVRDLGVTGSYDVKGTDISNHIAFKIAAVDGAYPIKDLALLTDIAAIPVESYALLSQMGAELADESVAVDVNHEKILTAINNMVNKSSIKFDFKADIVAAPVAADYQIKLARALTAEELGSDLAMNQIMQIVDIDANISLGKKLLEETPLGMLLMMGGKSDALIQEGDYFVSRISQRDGTMTINGVAVADSAAAGEDAAAGEEDLSFEDSDHDGHDHSDPNHTH